MGEHERMKVWLEDGETVYFCKKFNGADFTIRFPNGLSYDDDVVLSTIHCVVGEPLSFAYGFFRKYSYTSDTNVKDIEYDILPDGRPAT